MQESSTRSLLDEFDFAKIITSIAKFLIRARRHIIVALILAIITSIAYVKYATPEYESSMTAYSSNLQDEKAVGLIKDLERYLEEKDIEQLANKMSLSIEKSNKIVSMKAAIEVNKYKTGESKEGFTIKVRVTDQSILDSVGIGIKKYLESSEYVKDQISTTRLSLQYNITKTDDELRALDSLRSSLNKLILRGGARSTSTNLVMSDLSYIISKRIELNDRLSSLRQQLQLCYDVKVVKRFSKFKMKASPRLSITLLISILLFETVALLIFSWKSIAEFFVKLDS